MRNLQPPPKNCDTLGIHEKSEQDDCEDNRGESGETCNLNPDDRAKNPGIRKDLQPQRGPQDKPQEFTKLCGFKSRQAATTRKV